MENTVSKYSMCTKEGQLFCALSEKLVLIRIKGDKIRLDLTEPKIDTLIGFCLGKPLPGLRECGSEAGKVPSEA